MYERIVVERLPDYSKSSLVNGYGACRVGTGPAADFGRNLTSDYQPLHQITA